MGCDYRCAYLGICIVFPANLTSDKCVGLRCMLIEAQVCMYIHNNYKNSHITNTAVSQSAAPYK